MTHNATNAITLFSQVWWNRVMGAWNHSRERRKMSGLGAVCFQIRDVNGSGSCICWDDEGRASHAIDPPEAAPVFRATAENWSAFLDGEIQIPSCLFQGRIEYQGSLTRIIPYSAALNRFAKIARAALEEAGSSTDS